MRMSGALVPFYMVFPVAGTSKMASALISGAKAGGAGFLGPARNSLSP